MKKICYLYARVSTSKEDKKIISLNSQKRACVKYAKKNRYENREDFWKTFNAGVKELGGEIE